MIRVGNRQSISFGVSPKEAEKAVDRVMRSEDTAVNAVGSLLEQDGNRPEERANTFINLMTAIMPHFEKKKKSISEKVKPIYEEVIVRLRKVRDPEDEEVVDLFDKKWQKTGLMGRYTRLLFPEETLSTMKKQL